MKNGIDYRKTGMKKSALALSYHKAEDFSIISYLEFP
jgi:hypothetical protein